MSDPIATTTGMIKVGSMVATGSAIAELVIFNDVMYQYLAIIGALVSMSGVLHEILKERPIEHSIWQILVELLKGLVLGILAIPFWYLVLSSAGETLIDIIFDVTIPDMVNSVWLMVSFVMSWYTVPFIDGLVDKLRSLSKFKVSFNWKMENKDD